MIPGRKTRAQDAYARRAGFDALARIRDRAVHGLEVPDELTVRAREGGFSGVRIAETEIRGAQIGGTERLR